MNPVLLPFISYAILTTFTPGPNNITASTLGARGGYRRAMPFLTGMTAGFFTLLAASGLLADFILRSYSAVAPWIRWLGVAYMVWLALSPLIPHGRPKDGETRDPRFVQGFLLQFINPKGILYCVTLYSSFPSLLSGSTSRVLVASLGLAALGFSAVSLWATTGAVLKRFLGRPRSRRVFDAAMSLLLLWCAWSIATH
ncbi:MAG TPA: LysE family translocator [Rectinemataceae bacterium]|nr:LysE family translocator [Rectinemataceae bacterium]